MGWRESSFSFAAATDCVCLEVRARGRLNLGFQLAEQGRTEGAICAFSAALAATLGSKSPDDLRLRRTAASQLVLLMRESGEGGWEFRR